MKRYAVDVHLDFARCYVVEANSREEAEAKVEKQISSAFFDPLKDGFEQTGDIDIRCSGQEDEEGTIEYF